MTDHAKSPLLLLLALAACPKSSGTDPAAQGGSSGSAVEAAKPPAPPPAPPKDPCRAKTVAGIADLLLRQEAFAPWSDGTRALALDTHDDLLEWRDGCWRVVTKSPLPKPTAVIYRKDHLWLLAAGGHTATKDAGWQLGDPQIPVAAWTQTDAGVRTGLDPRAVLANAYGSGSIAATGDFLMTYNRTVWRERDGTWEHFALPADVAPAATDRASVVHERPDGKIVSVWDHDVAVLEIDGNGSARWTTAPIKITYLSQLAWTSPDGITYVPERSKIHAYDGKRWTVALAEEPVHFDAVFAAGGGIWATGHRTAENHTHVVSRDFYRLTKGRFEAVKSFTQPDLEADVVRPPMTVGEVTVVEALDHAFVYEGGDWRIVQKP